MDAKWLAILKESGWKTGAIAVASGIFLLLFYLEVLQPPENQAWIYVPTGILLVATSLAIASFIKRITDYIKPQERFDASRRLKKERSQINEELQYLDDRERDVLGYLLYNKTRMVSVEVDGGWIKTLISKGIFQSALRPGQMFDVLSVPYQIPPYVWQILEENRDQFPDKPSPRHRESDPPHEGGEWGERNKTGKLVLARDRREHPPSE